MTPSTRKLLIFAILAAGAFIALSTLDLQQPWLDKAVRSGVLAGLFITAAVMKWRRGRR